MLTPQQPYDDEVYNPDVKALHARHMSSLHGTQRANNLLNMTAALYVRVVSA
jgi:hypothetical protein